MVESGGNYSADNGACYGAFQLLYSYLGGDMSPAHQDQIAEQYMQSRYGSWQSAYEHEVNFGWW